MTADFVEISSFAPAVLHPYVSFLQLVCFVCVRELFGPQLARRQIGGNEALRTDILSQSDAIIIRDLHVAFI